MITFAKVRSSTIEGGKRILKVLQFGTKTAKEVSPFGFDSSPLDNWTAIYSETTNKSDSVIIGYINQNAIAESGESRMFSLGSDGLVLGWVHLKKNGNLELNGGTYSAVRFENLVQAIDNQNVLINSELAKIAIALTALGGTYIVSNIMTNLTASQSSTVKLK